MRPGRALWGYLIFVFIGAALISPWAHHGLVAAGFANIPFRRVVNRCLIGLALIGLWPFVKALGIRSVNEIGLRKYPGLGRDLAVGILMGSALLLLAGGSSLGVGASVFDMRTGWPKQIAGALGTAVVVSILEEILFRGAIFTAFSRVWGALAGLWMSSALYAILHFFSRPEDPTNIHWSSGFVILGRMLKGFTEFQTVVPGFLGLTLLGVIFALAFRKTGAIFMSIGIHASLIFWVKLFGFAANTAPNANTWFWGTEKLIDGWFCFILLTVATWWFARRQPQTA